MWQAKLLTAEERREAVIHAGLKVFGDRGFSGTPRAAVSTAVRISHAYLFRVFPAQPELVHRGALERAHV